MIKNTKDTRILGYMIIGIKPPAQEGWRPGFCHTTMLKWHAFTYISKEKLAGQGKKKKKTSYATSINKEIKLVVIPEDQRPLLQLSLSQMFLPVPVHNFILWILFNVQ